MVDAARHERTAHQLRMLSESLDSGRLGPVRRLVNSLSAAEIGNLLESLPPSKRNIVWGLVDAGGRWRGAGACWRRRAREPAGRRWTPDEIIAAVEDLDIDDLADLMEDLPDTVIDEVLKSMDRENRERLEQALSYPEDSAGRLMNPDVITVARRRHHRRGAALPAPARRNARATPTICSWSAVATSILAASPPAPAADP